MPTRVLLVGWKAGPFVWREEKGSLVTDAAPNLAKPLPVLMMTVCGSRVLCLDQRLAQSAGAVRTETSCIPSASKGVCTRS